MAKYLQRGEALDYTNATEELLPAGAIVTIGNHIGVTGCPIPAGKTGSLHVVGVFSIKKTGTSAIEMGQNVYFDGEGITDEDGGENANPIAGYAAAPAGASDDTILVKICG